MAGSRWWPASSPDSSSCSTSARPAAGPSRIPTATARFSRTTAEGTSRASCPYSAAIWAQSVSAASAAVAWQAAMAALDLVRARPPPLQRRLQQPRLGDLLASQRLRSWSSRGTSSPVASTRAARRASCSNSSASRPPTSGSSGSIWARIRASRMASAVRFWRTRSAPALAA